MALSLVHATPGSDVGLETRGRGLGSIERGLGGGGWGRGSPNATDGSGTLGVLEVFYRPRL